MEPDDAKTGPLLSCRTASAEADIEEQDPVYGHVQHLGSAADVLEIVGRGVKVGQSPNVAGEARLVGLKVGDELMPLAREAVPP